MFVLRGVLRAESQEKVLIYLLLRGAGYGKSIAEFYGVPINPIPVYPSDVINQLTVQRTRPRHAGKPLVEARSRADKSKSAGQ